MLWVLIRKHLAEVLSNEYHNICFHGGIGKMSCDYPVTWCYENSCRGSNSVKTFLATFLKTHLKGKNLLPNGVCLISVGEIENSADPDHTASV